MSACLNNPARIAIRGLSVLMPFFFLGAGLNQSSMDNAGKFLLLQLALAFVFALLSLRPEENSGGSAGFGLLDLALAAWLSYGLASAIFGLDFGASFWGAHGTYGAPLAGLISLGLWYLLVRTNASSLSLAAFSRLSAYSGGLVLAILSGVFFSAFIGAIKPDSALFSLARSAVGTTEQLSIYLAFLGVLCAALAASPARTASRWPTAALHLAVLAVLVFLVIFNFLPAWLCLFAGSAVLGAVSLIGNKRDNKPVFGRRLALAALLVAVSGLFLAFHAADSGNQPLGERLAPRLQLDWSATKDTALRSLGSQTLSGYGQEMFAPARSFTRLAGENERPYWYVRFNQGSSYFFEQLIYGGLIGFCLFALLLAVVLYFYIRSVFGKTAGQADPGEARFLLAPFAALIAALVVYSVNAVILFYFFAYAAYVGRQYQDPYPGRLAAPVRRGFPAPVRAGLFFIFCGFLAFASLFNARHHSAAFFYGSSQANGADEEKALKTALRLNPGTYQYPLRLSEHYHRQAMALLGQAAGDKEQDAQMLASQAVSYGQAALKAAPYAVAPYENLAKIYRDLGRHSPGAYAPAIRFFSQAIGLEPSNPILRTELGLAYLRQGDSAGAIAALEKARELKPRYYQTEYNLAKAYIAGGQNEAALDILRGLATEHRNIEIAYEQGRAHYNLKQYDEAVKKFSQVISAEPLHANALYSLGLSYSALGEVDLAMYYLKKAGELSPENFKLIEKINELGEEAGDGQQP